MNSHLNTLEPKLIWQHFKDILAVPRPSKREEKMIQFMMDFAAKNHLDAEKDAVGNVLIRKPATLGMENSPTVILQSHLDMVCEKNSDKVHDFDNDPIDTEIKDGWLYAKGTTLGADDGIGVAAAMAVLTSDNLKHGPIECLFTIDEESGMTGAFGLQDGFLKGEILLNLDSEDEGEVFIGCAGGLDTIGKLSFEKQDIPAGYYSCKVSVSGLKGGHSGDEIDKMLGNSNKILARFLWNQHQKYSLKISEFNGGNLRNAIPREAFALVSIPQHSKEQFRADLNIFVADIEREFPKTEPKVRMDLETEEKPAFAIDDHSAKRFLNLLMALPHGVHKWSQDIEGLVETSTNLASVKFIEENEIEIVTSQRSSSESSKADIAATVRSAFELAGATAEHTDGYPGWNPNPDSKILKISELSHKKLFGKAPKVRAIHAGLECGLFLEKYPELDMVSIGPTIRGAHSPEERIEIKTVQMFWDYLVDMLENIK